MSISINHNLLAANVANNLNDHYSRLAVSTQRLSSGLRVNGAADDAAGLAIRELQRSEIAALHQGVRNANDAISMIQTFDGALGVIDEKLIRMTELAEQAATGTYDSTQRLMIDSEFQAMGEEINRIARATDFNGIKLINGEFEVPPTEITGPDGKTYDVSLNGSFVDAWNSADATQNGDWDLSGITNPGALVGNHNITITNNNIMQIDGNFLLVDAPNLPNNIPVGTQINIVSRGPMDFGNGPESVFTINGNTVIAQNNNTTLTWQDNSVNPPITFNASLTDKNGNPLDFTAVAAGSTASWTAQAGHSFTASEGTVTPTMNGDTLTLELDLGNGNKITQSWDVTNGEDRALSSVSINLNIVDTTQKQDDDSDDKIPDNVVKIHFGPGNDSAEDYYYINKHDATLKGLGLEGVKIQTQDQAQDALVSVNNAIVAKDKIRAEYGADQNRLENTQSALLIQAENIQASESRISDADIAQEMTTFVRNQVLTQSAIAMLAQANSVPNMVMRLIGA